MNNVLFFSIILALLGLYYVSANSLKSNEGFSSQPRCPNLLIQKGSRFYLYNSKLAQVPGVNPIEFDNLEDYSEFLDWQRSQGIRCPVLYLQSTFDAQGNPVYKVRPSVSEPQGGLPPSTMPPVGIASMDANPILESSLGYPNQPAYPNPTLLVDAGRNDPPYNKGSYPAYDETSYYVGTTTPLDMMDINEEKKTCSASPMDPNWCGPKYTQELVDKGYYKENEISLYINS